MLLKVTYFGHDGF